MVKLKKRSDEYLLHKFSIIVKSITKIVTSIVSVCYVFFPTYFLYLSVKILAGQQTTANIFVSIISALKLSQILPIGIGAGGVLLSYHERKLRKTHIQHSAFYQKKLEEIINKNRLSSLLSPDGSTPREAK